MNTEIVYTFEAIAFYDEDDGQYKPSVKTFINGNFYNWQVLELGFDEPRFAMPYAREFLRELASVTRQITGAWVREQR